MFTKRLKKIFLTASASSLIPDVRRIIVYSSYHLKRHYRAILLAFLLKFAAFPFAISLIYITRAAIDRGILAGNLGSFLLLTISGLALYSLSGVLNFFSLVTIRKIKASFSREVNDDLTRRLFEMDILAINSASSDENAFTLWYDYRNIENLMFYELPALGSFVKIPVLILLVSFISLPLTFFILLAAPLMLLQTAWASRNTRRLRLREFYSTKKYSSAFHDILINIRMIKGFFRENWAAGRISSLFGIRARRELDASLFKLKVSLLGDVLIKLNMAAFAIAGGYMVISGSLSFGSLSAVTMYAALVVSEMYSAGSVVTAINGERTSFKRCAEFIRAVKTPRSDRDRGDTSGGVRYSPFRGNDQNDIELKSVRFGYPGGEDVLKGVSLYATGGKWTLLRGVSGSGKTTLLSLIMRLYSPGEGDILLGGKSIFLADTFFLASKTAAVYQEPYLLKDTLENNILLGGEKSRSGFEKAVKASGVGGIAEALPGGYDSVISESGSSLSGGQKQRIAIARALAREPEVLIMDEATSFVDAEGEEEIFGNIRSMYPSLTVLYVSHRDTEKKYADEVYTLEDGRLEKEENEKIIS